MLKWFDDEASLDRGGWGMMQDHYYLDEGMRERANDPTYQSEICELI